MARVDDTARASNLRCPVQCHGPARSVFVPEQPQKNAVRTAVGPAVVTPQAEPDITWSSSNRELRYDRPKPAARLRYPIWQLPARIHTWTRGVTSRRTNSTGSRGTACCSACCFDAASWTGIAAATQETWQ